MLYNCQNRISYIGIIAEVRFASFLSGGFITMAVMNPPEKTGKTNICAMARRINYKVFTVFELNGKA